MMALPGESVTCTRSPGLCWGSSLRALPVDSLGFGTVYDGGLRQVVSQRAFDINGTERQRDIRPDLTTDAAVPYQLRDRWSWELPEPADPQVTSVNAKKPCDRRDPAGILYSFR